MSKSKRESAARKGLTIDRRFRHRLNRHFLACSATAAAAVGGGSAEAGIIYRSVNGAIPVDNNGGLFLDLDTGAFSTGNSIAGYDLNFFEQAGTQLLQLRMPNNSVNGAFGFTNGPYAYASNVAANTAIIQPAPCPTGFSGLIGFWPGEGNANDTTGAHNGTLQGATFAPGKVGSAFSFNGSSSSVDLGNWFNFQTFTIALWVNVSANQIQFADIMDNNHTGSRSWVIQYDNTGTQFHYGAVGDPSNITFSLTPGTWQLLVITRDANRVTTGYLDGTSLGSYTSAVDITYDGTQFLRLGRWGGGGRFLAGLIDEPAIYNRALSQAEVQSLTACRAPAFVPYGILAAVDSNGAGPRHGPWANGVTGGYVGFRFKSAQNATLYGWARLNVFAGLVPNNGSVGTLVDYAYDDSGAAIVTGQLPLPVVTTQPGSLAVFLGDLASFVAASTNAPSTAKWQVSTNGGGSFTDIPGATSTTLTFRPVATQSGNLYRIVFTNSAGVTSSNAATLTVISTDTDGDGMTDHFEDLYGLNKNDPTDAGKDKDGDGLTNLQEFQAGTNPNDRTSVFHITAFNDSAGVAKIRFTTITYKNYRVEKNDDLTNAAGWSLVSLSAGTGAELEIPDPTAGSAPLGRRFYRVTVEAQP